MKILIANVQVPFTRGGAEMQSESLLQALRAEGHLAEIVTVPFKGYPADVIPDQMLACGLLDISSFNGPKVDKVIALKFPAYLIPHPNKTIWLMHQHRQAYDLWGTPYGLNTEFMGAHVRDYIRQVDTRALGDATPVYTTSSNVSHRLQHYCGVPSSVLYHPPAGAERYAGAEASDYLFYPSRIDPLKRQTLVIEALARTRHPVRVRFASSSTLETYETEIRELIARLHLEDRVDWLGQITEEEKRRQYAHCLGVVFLPVDEDYGYVTLEAMLASKPVITCSDSGGPLEFVLPDVTGLIAAPDASQLAELMDQLWMDRAAAMKMGKEGRARYDSMDISWKNVLDILLQ